MSWCLRFNFNWGRCDGGSGSVCSHWTDRQRCRRTSHRVVVLHCRCCRFPFGDLLRGIWMPCRQGRVCLCVHLLFFRWDMGIYHRLEHDSRICDRYSFARPRQQRIHRLHCRRSYSKILYRKHWGVSCIGLGIVPGFSGFYSCSLGVHDRCQRSQALGCIQQMRDHSKHAGNTLRAGCRLVPCQPFQLGRQTTVPSIRSVRSPGRCCELFLLLRRLWCDSNSQWRDH